MLEAPEETEHQQLLAQTCLCASRLAKMETEPNPGCLSHPAQHKALPAATGPGAAPGTPAPSPAARGAPAGNGTPGSAQPGARPGSPPIAVAVPLSPRPPPYRGGRRDRGARGAAPARPSPCRAGVAGRPRPGEGGFWEMGMEGGGCRCRGSSRRGGCGLRACPSVSACVCPESVVRVPGRPLGSPRGGARSPRELPSRPAEPLGGCGGAWGGPALPAAPPLSSPRPPRSSIARARGWEAAARRRQRRG